MQTSPFTAALAHYQGGQLVQAGEACRQILAADPRHFDALHLLGLITYRSGQPARAAELLGEAMAVNAGNASAHNALGVVLAELGSDAQALASFERAIALKPSLTTAVVNRANMLQRLKRYDEALAAHDQAIALKADFADAHYNRGRLLMEMGRAAEAVESYDRALATAPASAETWNNRGLALSHLGDHGGALASHDRAAALAPGTLGFQINQGVALSHLGRHDEAQRVFEEILAQDPDHPDAHWNRSLCLLRHGNFEHGWAEHEWRWKSPLLNLRRHTFDAPLWQGDEDLAGKTVLLHSDQGFGDTLQFCRYAALVQARGGTVALAVQAPLQRLLAYLGGVDHLARADERFDMQCPLSSLPFVFATRAETIPARSGYLIAEHRLAEKWQARLGEKKAPRVGLVWSGSRQHLNDHNRSIPLSTLMAALPQGFDYISLQQEIRAGDVPATGALQHFGEHLTDFAETAALCTAMDVVITVDTSVAHLAGALGKTVWILLAFNPDWRWMLARADSPWYASARLYRQVRAGDWASVLTSVAADLISDIARR